MAVEYEGLRYSKKPALLEVIDFLHGISQEEQWSIVRREIRKAASMVSQGKPILFFLADKTSAGGPHFVQALCNPQQKSVFLEVPEEPQQRGGRFPTVLHALEVIVGTIALANQTEKPFNPNGEIISPQQKLSYPEIKFVKTLREQIEEPAVILVPLTVDPDKTNVIIFHPQARRINPETLAQKYYGIIQTDTELPKDLLRHTMLVHALPETGLSRKQDVIVKVLPKEEGHFYRLMHTGRIAEWFNLDPSREIIVERIL